MQVAVASVRIKPDLTGFRTQLRVEVKAATAGVTGTVKVKPDLVGFRTQLRAEVKAATAKVKATVQVRVQANRQALAGFAAQTGAVVQRAGTSAGNTFASAFSRSSTLRFRKLNRLFLEPINNFQAALNKIVMPARLAGLASAFLGLLPSLSLATAAVGAGLIPAMLSFVTVGGTIRLLLGNLAKDIKGQALKQLNAMSDSFKELAREAAKPGLNAFFKAAVQLAPVLRNYVKEIATAIGGVGFELAALMDTPAFRGKLQTLLDGVAAGTKTWLGALDAVVDMVVTLGAAAVPIFQRIAANAANAAEKWRDWLNLKSETGELQAFLRQAWEELARWGRIAGNVVGGLFNIFSAGVGPSTQFAGNLERITKSFKDWTEKSENIEKIRGFFQWMTDHVGDFFRIAASAFLIAGALKSIHAVTSVIDFARMVLMLGPLGVVMGAAGLAIAGVAAGFFLAYNRSETFRKKVSEIWAMIKERALPIFKDWGGWIRDKLVPALEDFANSALENVRVGLEKVLTKVEENEEGLKGLRDIMLLTVEAGKFLAKGFTEEVSGSIGHVVTALGWLGRGVEAAKVAFRNVKQWAGTAVNETVEFFRGLPGRIGGALKALPGALKTLAGNALDGFVGAVGFGLGKVVGFFVQLPGRVIKYITGFWATAQTLFKTGRDAVVKFVQELPDKVASALANLLPKAKKRFEDAWKGAQDITGSWFAKITTFIGLLPGRAFEALRDLGGKIVARFKAGWDAGLGESKTKVNAVIAHIAGIPKRAWDALAALAGQLRSRASTAWQAFLTVTSEKITAVINLFKGLPGRARDAFNSQAAAVKTALSNAWESARATASAKVAAIVEFFRGLPGRGRDAFNSGAAALKAAVANAGESIRATASGKVAAIVQFFKELPGKAKAGFLAAAGGLVSAVAAKFAEIRDRAKGPLNGLIDLLNKFIGLVNKLPGVNFSSIPRLNEGGPVENTSRPTIGGRPFRKGGKVPGSGPNRDTVPAMLSPGEYVIQRPAVKALGGAFLAAMNKAHSLDIGGDPGGVMLGRGRLNDPRRGTRLLNGGGWVLNPLYRAAGGSIPDVQAWIKQQDSKPYRWGGTGPGSFDCSGLTGAAYGKLTGRGGGNGQRYHTTSSNFAAQGWKPGKGTYTVGVSPGSHMAGNLAGLGFEARSSKTGIFVGGSARSVTSFPQQWYLPQVGGKFSGAGGGVAAGIARAALNAILGPARSGVNGLGDGLVAQIAKAIGNKALDALVKSIEDKVGVFHQGGYVARNQLAYLQQGERVLSAAQERGRRAGGDGATAGSWSINVDARGSTDPAAVEAAAHRGAEAALSAYRQSRTVRPRR